MRVNYEEKSFENYFNIELNSKSKVFFPFGQVQENFIGADSSAYSKNRQLWKMFGYPFCFYPDFKGIKFQEIANLLEKDLRSYINNFPEMKTNILFQYKKPEYFKNSSAKEWSSWKHPYYRYDIYPEQHDLLIYLSDKLKNKVLILYASPAIANINDLVKAYTNKKIIESSNFTTALSLKGHKRNTYKTAGRYSIAFSEPTEIDNFNFVDLISNDKKETKGDNNFEFIVSFEKQITNSMVEYPALAKEFITTKEVSAEFADFPILHSFMEMINFKNLTGLQWLITF
jgi:hypothetical protein